VQQNCLYPRDVNYATQATEGKVMKKSTNHQYNIVLVNLQRL